MNKTISVYATCVKRLAETKELISSKPITVEEAKMFNSMLCFYATWIDEIQNEWKYGIPAFTCDWTDYFETTFL